MTIGILFVCTGNICRSPMAEGVFRTMADRAGLASAFTVDSAGSYAGHAGEPPSRLAREAAARRGYHLAELRRLAPRGFAERPRLFVTADVADPYGGSERDYERALDLIEAGCRELLATLTPFHAPLPLGGEAG